MRIVDVDALVAEIDSNFPCGPNLEYDPEFHDLEQAVLGKPEVQYGEMISPAVPPDWKVVKRIATSLTQRSRDIRIIVPLLRAVLDLNGITAMAECLQLIQRLLEERWDMVHPQLDVEDDFDPMLRINSLAMLADGGTVIREVREATLLILPGIGAISVRDLEIAASDVQVAEGQSKIAMSSIEAAARDVDSELIASAAAAMRMAFDCARHIETLLVAKVGSSQALNLDPLTRVLARGRDFLEAAIARDHQESVVVEDSQPGSEPGSEPGQNQTDAGNARRGATEINGDINSRDEVLRMLEKICAYYRRCEPSSPVPLLLERARRLVPKNFLEIMEDLAPEGMAQLTVISGPQPSQQ